MQVAKLDCLVLILRENFHAQQGWVSLVLHFCATEAACPLQNFSLKFASLIVTSVTRLDFFERPWLQFFLTKVAQIFVRLFRLF